MNSIMVTRVLGKRVEIRVQDIDGSHTKVEQGNYSATQPHGDDEYRGIIVDHYTGSMLCYAVSDRIAEVTNEDEAEVWYQLTSETPMSDLTMAKCSRIFALLDK